MPLSPFDHVFIRRSPGFEKEQLVTLRGEVRYPGQFAISSSNERISDVVKRAGGLSDFAYPKGASLIRRTIYFEEKSEEEIREERLREIKDNLDPEKNRNTNEAEQILFERIEKKLAQIEEEKQKEEQQRLRSQLFKVSVPTDSISIDSALNASRYKEQDLVGIDLEYIMQNPGSEADLILFEGDILQIPKQ
ncbi:MAG TPA: polysaccharide biosynthesis protein, partial [Algoriphagus sp.]|nr:polysaccharide biosynthesis protein [Algoriphagus sp.]